MRALACSLLLVAGCKLYSPELVDCSIQCGPSSSCPADTVCKNGLCRLPNATNSCDCKPGQDRPCGGGKGECTAGLQRCGSDGLWGGCLGEVKPTTEKCDNKDNDCDGVIDNDPSDAPPCSKHLGVCASALQQCLNGSYVDCAESDYGLSYQAQETLCDSLDNDCDGVVDGSADKLLATGVLGDWELLAYASGFALVTVRTSTTHPASQDIVIDRFDPGLVPVGTSLVVGTDSSVRMAARNEGSTVYVVWKSGTRLEPRRVMLDGTITPLTAVPNADIQDGFQLGLSPTLLVAAFEGQTNAARSVEWPLPSGTPINRRLDVDQGGVPKSSTMYNVLASRGGKFVAYYADGLAPPDGGSSQSFSRVLLTGGLTEVSAAYAGPSSANFFESPFDTAVSIYDSSFYGGFFGFPSSSGIYVQTNVLDGGAEYTVKESGDSSEFFSCHAVPTASGAALAYVDGTRGQVVLASQAQVGLSTVVHSRNIDTTVGYGPPRVASNGTPSLGLAVNVLGSVYARRICTP